MAGTKNRCPLSPVVSKTSSGAIELMDFYSLARPADFLESLKGRGWTVLGADIGSPDFRKYIASNIQPDTGKVVLVLGAEGTGISEEIGSVCDAFLTISGLRGRTFPETLVDSVNVGVASGILIQELARHLKI